MYSVLLAVLSLFLASTVIRAQVLRDFQVAQPPVVPKDTKQCTVQVLQRDFANSFGNSEIVTLVPPTDCGEPGTWAAITLNLTVTSNGTQFDRLGIFALDGTEIWRTSTPEPTRDGIIWTYLKDVSQYTPLFSKPGTFIFQLDNLIQDNLNGVYSTVVHATYYASSPTAPPAKQANMIIPLSTRSDDSGSTASVPPAFNISVALPQNTVELYAEIFASGNGQEEFWFANAANEFMDDIPLGSNITLSDGPFREVRLAVDGQVVGTAFPYVTIFTGGAAPPLWRPITSYGALELPTYHLDLTAFLPLLTDNQNHTFTLDVVSAERDHAILQNWFLTSNLQVVTSNATGATTGNITVLQIDEFPQTSVSGNVSQDHQTVDILVTGSRRIHVESTIVSPDGETNNVVWDQQLDYTNVQNYLEGGIISIVDQRSTGNVRSTHNGVEVVRDGFEYPLRMNMTFLDKVNLSNWTTTIDHSYNRDLLATPLVLGTTINNHQVADAFFQLASSGNFGNGTNNNTFSYVDTAGNTYTRNVGAAFNNIIFDEEGGTLAPSPIPIGPVVGTGEETQQEVMRFAGTGRMRLDGTTTGGSGK